MKNLFSELFKYMGKFKLLLILSSLFATLSALFNMYSFICIYDFISLLINTHGHFNILKINDFTYYGLKFVFYISGGFGLYGMSLLFSHICAYHTVANIRILIIEKLGKLSLGYHLNNPSGKLRKIIEKNSDTIESLIAHQIPDFIQAMILPILFISFIFYYDYRLAIISLIPVILAFTILALMLKDTSKSLALQYQKSAEDISNAAVEYVRGIGVVKIFNQTATSFSRYKSAVKEYKDYVIKYALSMKYSDSLYNTIINGIFLFLIPSGIILYNLSVDKKSIILSFSFFIILSPYIVSILNKIMKSSSQLMIASASIKAINNILNETNQYNSNKDNQIINDNIYFKNISFSYTNNDNKVLNDINLKIKKGTINAFVCPSGSGKSTIANLLARFYDNYDGEILIGDINIKDINYKDWMNTISFVFQDTSLLKMSIYDNVRYFNKNASKEDVLKVLHEASCDDIIEKLPLGIDTIIGSTGIYLSGGEIQRLNIARAILKDAPIIILDEATAFADSENEYLIQNALNVLLKDKTVIMIAHRLRTIINCDNIIVLNNGEIVEQGQHNVLINNKKLYYKLYSLQKESSKWNI